MAATTKENLIITASKIFADYGFDGATTRMITKELGVSLSSIPFHFETKENLYRAVLERAAKYTMDYFSPLLEEIKDKVNMHELNKKSAREYLKLLVEKEVDWCLTDSPEDIIKLFVREYNSPTIDNDIIFNALYKNLISSFTDLIMIYTGIDDREWTFFYMLSIGGEMVIFAEQLYFIKKTLNTKTFSGLKDIRMRETLIHKVLYSIDNTKNIYNLVENL